MNFVLTHDHAKLTLQNNLTGKNFKGCDRVSAKYPAESTFLRPPLLGLGVDWGAIPSDTEIPAIKKQGHRLPSK